MHLICDPAADDIVTKCSTQRAINTVPDAITQGNAKLVVSPAFEKIGKIVRLKAKNYLCHVQNEFPIRALVTNLRECCSQIQFQRFAPFCWADFHPTKMLRHGRMAGHVKLRRGIDVVDGSRLRAVHVWGVRWAWQNAAADLPAVESPN